VPVAKEAGSAPEVSCGATRMDGVASLSALFKLCVIVVIA